MKTLAQIIVDTNSVTDKNGEHSYVDSFYDKEFAKYQDKPITLIEIGVNYGGSARLWFDYFPLAKIHCLDVQVSDPEFKRFADNELRINYIIENAYTKLMANALPDYDIFIDDGPHTLDSQLQSINIYLPKMNDGGVFVIEDVQDISHLDIMFNYAKGLYGDKYEYELLDLRSNKNRYDDLMFIARKV